MFKCFKEFVSLSFLWNHSWEPFEADSEIIETQKILAKLASSGKWGIETNVIFNRAIEALKRLQRSNLSFREIFDEIIIGTIAVVYFEEGRKYSKKLLDGKTSKLVKESQGYPRVIDDSTIQEYESFIRHAGRAVLTENIKIKIRGSYFDTLLTVLPVKIRTKIFDIKNKERYDRLITRHAASNFFTHADHYLDANLVNIIKDYVATSYTHSSTFGK